MSNLIIECVVNGPIETNSYFAIAGDVALAIDPALDGEGLARDFAQKHPGVSIEAIVCTHGHADHVSGVAGMRCALGEQVPFMMSEKDCPLAVSHVEDFHRRGLPAEAPGEPTRYLCEGDTVRLGDVIFHVLETPGHTVGGIVLYAETSSGHVAFVGDTLFPGGCGRTDLEGGDEEAIIRSLGKLGRTLPPDTVCYIGHGPTTTIERELKTNPVMIQGLQKSGGA